MIQRHSPVGRRRLPTGLAVLTLVFAMTACGGGTDDEGVARLDDETGEPSEQGADRDPQLEMEEASLAFVQCLRDEGLDVGDPEFDADGNLDLFAAFAEAQEQVVDLEAAEEARDACLHHLEGVALQFMLTNQSELEDRMLDYAGCMRDNGYDMPDPDFSSLISGGMDGMPAGGPLGDIDFEDAAFIEANEECIAVFADLEIGSGGTEK